MTDEDLLAKGYHEFILRGFDAKDYRIKGFQKRFDDEQGKKYFITVYRDHLSVNGVDMLDGYEFIVQLYRKGDHAPLNLEFFSYEWDIASVEEYTERIFQNGFEHYEKWGE